MVDKDGKLCPTAAEQLKFYVNGAGIYRAVCNGDATSLELIHLPTMKTFSGKLAMRVQETKQLSTTELTVSGDGL